METSPSTPQGNTPVTTNILASFLTMPKRTIDHLLGTKDRKRQRKRQAPRASGEVQRPVTAVSENASHASDHSDREGVRPKIAPDAIAPHTPDTMLVTTDFMRQIATMTRGPEDVHKAQFIRSNARKQLTTAQRRLVDLRRAAAEIRDWLIDNKSQMVARDEDPEAAEKEVSERIESYDKHHSELGEAIEDIERQIKRVNQEVSALSDRTTELRKTVEEKLLDLLELSALPTLLDENVFHIEQPKNEEFLKTWEEDYDQFCTHVLGRRSLSAEIAAFRIADDAPQKVLQMHAIRRRHQGALEELARLNEAAESGADHTITPADIEVCKEKAEELRLSLLAAVHDVRCTNTRCRSNGSLITLDGDWAEDHFEQGDPYREERERLARQDVEEEMTQEEIEEYLESNRNKTDNWLNRVDEAQDPDEAGPISPKTPGGASFRERLREVGVNDSVSVVSGNSPKRTR